MRRGDKPPPYPPYRNDGTDAMAISMTSDPLVMTAAGRLTARGDTQIREAGRAGVPNAVLKAPRNDPDLPLRDRYWRRIGPQHLAAPFEDIDAVGVLGVGMQRVLLTGLE